MKNTDLFSGALTLAALLACGGCGDKVKMPVAVAEMLRDCGQI